MTDTFTWLYRERVFRIFRILIDFPALDRALDYLERNQRAQAKIDAQTQRIRTITSALKAAVSHEETQTK